MLAGFEKNDMLDQYSSLGSGDNESLYGRNDVCPSGVEIAC